MPRTAGATIFGLAGPDLSADETAFFREADPWGFILFARNIATPAQVQRLTSSLRAAVGREAPVFVDQEGGRVQRLRPPHWRDWLPPLDQMARTADPEAGARAMWLRHRLIAAELRAAGIDANCAPCCDVAGEATHPFLRNRCFGIDPVTVARAARAAAEGLLAGGVLPVVKHIPGHGRATADSHLSLPRVAAARDELMADIAPFAALADLPMAMTAHVVFDGIDPERPATTSPEAVALIRGEIGFGGLLMTDDLGMQALAGGFADRAGAALAAGCDVILHCSGTMDEMEAVAEAAGRLAPGAAARAAAALARRHPPEPVDIAALEREFSALVSGA
ncbi:beta-N-acetylhexosaminidase [Frigidibacter oleivorans]|uniref:beta-N-acetylhexosaminidase n=1 Tax=Frigidibacter oleivorans TaxID=2487129 RepID=UPI000F8DA9F0|nr:beta-N-acetylhexosaminidase [Frigidibacter oleivorans]